MILAQEAEDARRPANAGSDFDKELGGCARAERVQMLDTALQAEPIKRVEVNHGVAFRARRGCTGAQKRLFA